MSDTAILVLCGLHSVGFAVFHTAFRRLFRWREDLAARRPRVRSRALFGIGAALFAWPLLR